LVSEALKALLSYKTVFNCFDYFRAAAAAAMKPGDISVKEQLTNARIATSSALLKLVLVRASFFKTRQMAVARGILADEGYQQLFKELGITIANLYDKE
jgi:hypothetical protein